MLSRSELTGRFSLNPPAPPGAIECEEAEYGGRLPGFFMIGDDGGGSAILLNLQDRRVYEVDMGAMDEESMELCAESLDELLALGTSLGERGG